MPKFKNVALVAALASLSLLSACATTKKPPPTYDDKADWVPINGSDQYGMSCPHHSWTYLCNAPKPTKGAR